MKKKRLVVSVVIGIFCVSFFFRLFAVVPSLSQVILDESSHSSHSQNGNQVNIEDCRKLLILKIIFYFYWYKSKVLLQKCDFGFPWPL